MTDIPVVFDHDKHSTLTDVYSQFSHLGNLHDFFYDWGGFNEWLFKIINNIRLGSSYDAAMTAISKLGDKWNFPYYMAGLLAFVLITSIVQKMRGKAGIRPRLVMWFGVFAVLCVGFVAYIGVVTTLKDYFAYPRPYVALENVHQIEIRPADDANHSFPSGHVAFITLMIIGLWPMFAHEWRWFMLLIIAAVAWSRVSLGVHFPADALWGFLIISSVVIIIRAVTYTVLRKLFGLNC